MGEGPHRIQTVKIQTLVFQNGLCEDHHGCPDDTADEGRDDMKGNQLLQVGPIRDHGTQSGRKKG